LPMSIATGAAGTHLGPNALATLAELKSKGLSMRKVCALSQTLFHLKLTPGGLSHALRRAGQKCEPAYQGLTDVLQPSSQSDQASLRRPAQPGAGYAHGVRALPP